MTHRTKVLKSTDVLLNYLKRAVMVGSLHNKIPKSGALVQESVI